MRLRELREQDRAPLERILRETLMFTDAEIDVALELLDVGLGQRPGDGYAFLVAEQDGDVVGYACFGPTPATDGTWDLYWVAVDRSRQRSGIGRALVAAVEEHARALGGRLLVVETSGRDAYAPTRAFYERSGYPEHARIRDFYRDGDDKVLHVKRL